MKPVNNLENKTPLDTLKSSVNMYESFYRYYFGRCSSELAQLLSLPYS